MFRVASAAYALLVALIVALSISLFDSTPAEAGYYGYRGGYGGYGYRGYGYRGGYYGGPRYYGGYGYRGYGGYGYRGYGGYGYRGYGGYGYGGGYGYRGYGYGGYYRPYYRPLPPGLARHYYRGGYLPIGWERRVRPVPVYLEPELVVVPAGYQRGIIDGRAVVYNNRGLILDVAVLF